MFGKILIELMTNVSSSMIFIFLFPRDERLFQRNINKTGLFWGDRESTTDCNQPLQPLQGENGGGQVLALIASQAAANSTAASLLSLQGLNITDLYIQLIQIKHNTHLLNTTTPSPINMQKKIPPPPKNFFQDLQMKPVFRHLIICCIENSVY